jgi:hypothetical protein
MNHADPYGVPTGYVPRVTKVAAVAMTHPKDPSREDALTRAIDEQLALERDARLWREAVRRGFVTAESLGV